MSGAAIADYYPKFSLTGDFGLDSTQFHHLFDWESRYFIIYPNIDWRLFDFGRTAAEVEQEKERHQQTSLAYQGAVLTALREVEDALVAYANEQDHHAALAGAVASARESVDISLDQYKQGIIDFLPILDAQRQLLTAQDDLAQSDQALSTNLVALYKALGGGLYRKLVEARFRRRNFVYRLESSGERSRKRYGCFASPDRSIEYDAVSDRMRLFSGKGNRMTFDTATSMAAPTQVTASLCSVREECAKNDHDRRTQAGHALAPSRDLAKKFGVARKVGGARESLLELQS